MAGQSSGLKFLVRGVPSPQREGGLSLLPPLRTSRAWESAPGIAEGLAARASRSKADAVMGLSKLASGWRKGAIKGNAEDPYQLANCYDAGTEGVKRDQVAAMEWLGKSAAQDHAGAQCTLGELLSAAEGVEQNLEVAAQWYLRAADLGNADAQGHLGHCYANGTGVEQEDAQAVAWWEKGAKGGDFNSQ